MFLGELGLDGKIRGVKGVLPVVLQFMDKGFNFIVPGQNASEVALAGILCNKFYSLNESCRFF